MNPKIKDILGWGAVAAIAIFIIGTLQFTSAYSRSVVPSASFAVTGESRVTVVPDVAQFSFGIVTEGGKDISALKKDNTAKANAAIDYVKSQGIDPKDIETQNYNISPRYQNFSCPPVVYSAGSAASSPCPPSQIVGYTINQNITVKVKDFDKIGEIISGVTERGANNVSDLSFTVKDRDKAENEARGKAIAKAKEKAKELAKAGNFRLGRIVSIQESSYAPSPYNRVYGMGGAEAMDVKSIAPSIQPGSDEIVSQMTITYAIN
jgi:uncharacterized protein YggE